MGALRAERIGLTVIFAADGAVFASWAARLPQVQVTVGAGAGSLGVALVGTAVGALPAMAATGWLCRRARPLRVACVAVLLLCAALQLPGRADTPSHLAAVLVAFGACYGATDVAMNSAAVDLAARVGRPIVPAFHGAYSIGALAGAGCGAVAAGSGLPVRTHLAVVAAVAGAAVVAATAPPFLARAPRARGDRPDLPERTGRIVRAAAIAAVLTGAAAFVEGVVANWSGIHLLSSAHAAAWVAPLGFALLSLAEAVTRLRGPRLVERFGAAAVGTAGALAAAAGLGLALIPAAVPQLIGYAVAGVGLANLFPLGIARAGGAGGSLGVSIASTVGYAGFLFGPPVIGLVAQAVGLSTALVLPVLVVAAAVVAARVR